jgi:sporulation integral membrane protein YtvI
LNHYLKLIANIIIPIAILGLLVMALPRIAVFFLPFLLGFLISVIAAPFIRLLHQKTHLMQRKHASLVIIVVLFLLIGLLLYYAGNLLVHAIRDFVVSIPSIYKDLSLTINEMIAEHQDVLHHLLPGSYGDMASKALSNLESNFNQYASDFIANASSPVASISLDVVRSLPTLLVYAVVTIISAYLFSKDGDVYKENIRKWIPERFFQYGKLLKRDISKILQGWLLAQFQIMFVVFLVLAIGLLILRVRFAVPLALLTAFLDFLPMFGVGFIFWPWIVMDLFSGKFLEALGLLVIYVATQIVRQFMQPKIMGDTMGLPPFMTILFLYLGFKFYGLAGMIFAVPVGMLFLCFYRYGAFDKMLASVKELVELLLSFL